MLGINISDVINVLKSVRTQLIVIGIVLILAVLISIFVNKRTVKDTAAKKMVRSQTWIAALIAVFAAVATMLFGPLNTIVTSVTTPKYELSKESITKASKLAVDIQREGIVMLQNNDSQLPLQTKKVNVFGWASTNPIYGGTGSGSMNDSYATTSLLQGLKDAGISYNTELSDFYTKYNSTRPVVGMNGQDWTLPEPPVDTYPNSMLSKAKNYSDTAVITIARSGGEGADLPSDMGTVETSKPGTKIEGSGFDLRGTHYVNNSNDYADFKAGDSYLSLSQTEKNLIGYVTKNFRKVVLVYNGANNLNLNFVSQYPQIKSVLWCPPAGQTGFDALGEILAGKQNPSGRTTDTFVKDFTKTPWWNNFGSFNYDNMQKYEVKGMFGTSVPSYVNYVEGIYVGYRFYETAAMDGAITYDDVVQYPFGYGMSYTTFSQTMTQPQVNNGKVTFNVTVTNTGTTAGKDTVEVYYNPPYTNGGIEKASANLIRFKKTKELAPGASQRFEISFDLEEMASYDYKNAKAYVLESGSYGISINRDSHNMIDSKAVTVDSTVTYGKGNHRSSDRTDVTNQFDNAEGHVTYLSRKDSFANYSQATAKPASSTMPEDQMKEFVGADYKAPEGKASAKMPVTGAKNGTKLYQLYGKSYDDPLWDKLLDNLTVNEMNELISMAGYNNAEVSSIGKPRQSDIDGPAALNNNFTKVGSIGFPASTTVANTFNKGLAQRYGDLIGQMGREMHVTGWYAPAMNTHRTPFAGRNFEYFSEDPILGGSMAAQQLKAAKAKGVCGFMKHFALNDQEDNRMNMLCTWSNEQAIREVYLRQFEMAAKDGGATAVMSSFNYIGARWSASNPNLLNNVLRGEWGFRGFVETDYFAGGPMIGDEAIRGGNDAMLATTKTTNYITRTNEAETVQLMRKASHNILYTAVNSWLYKDGQPSMDASWWKKAFYIALAVVAALVILLEVFAFRRYFRRRRELKGASGMQKGSAEKQPDN
ncbi:glycoside hydrolase family 3 C-terminal domain-containing protein [Scardovia wiggsiae]|uniref:beta-glucosidase n=1 Tax=Scardovia wiggsiae TaxID=230143 RepID=UPI00374ED5C8